MKLTFLLLVPALIGGALLTQTTPCTLTVTPDEVRGAAYHVRFTVAASCSADTVFRVRKSSTISTKRRGAPYQPIKPLTGAWEISKTKTTLPTGELWTSILWRWEQFDPSQLNTVTGEAGRWRGVPVERGP
ncbi:hypothetical protein EHF33_03165 [Deinococcus psychrotolerans]|uniref:Uncharacterized protein n=1 Tax=Deinococcus psychrotolerans TaxID=2489213 RepID=A0A3G8YAE9_9DEIO|nr:hypothetical protein [Deinococcus psychrotolerans]AZI41873.1 hypothetical protein EHF33_03165 [Deinococcus psychrotolerans]